MADKGRKTGRTGDGRGLGEPECSGHDRTTLIGVKLPKVESVSIPALTRKGLMGPHPELRSC